ncbi:hypothetical protein ACG9ZL_19830 [Acinetobacter sp. ULE_I057]|uniref:hypothetical protein n=1 Tax=Acinetobacter sp. ULE_I057 TaxID=3373070 RepID=UPI003AF65B8E
MSSKVISPYPIFNDVDGDPLDAGYTYIGETGKNPEVYPVPVFFDENLSIPAPQPIRTRNGYISQSGKPAKLYIANEKCSVTIKNKRKTIIWTDLNADLSFTVDGINKKIKSTITYVNSIAELLSLEAWEGRTVQNNGLQKGLFKFNKQRLSENDGGTIFNGWERQYSGGVYAEWFGADNTGVTDIGSSLQKAFDSFRCVNLGDGDFLLTSVVGLPYVSNYGDNDIRLVGTGQTKAIVNSTTPVFTSKASLSNPNSPENLFCGKVYIDGINFSSTIANAKIFNLDRIYNFTSQSNTYYKIGSVGYSSLLRSAENIPYMQSIQFIDNKFSECDHAIDGYAAFNVEWKSNHCEGCGDLLNFKDYTNGSGTVIKSRIQSLQIDGGMHEGGGLFLKASNVYSLQIDGQYLESNTKFGAGTNKCNIYLTPDYVYSLAGSIKNLTCGNIFTADNTWQDIKIVYDNTPYTAITSHSARISVSDCWTTAYYLFNKDSYVRHFNNQTGYSAALGDTGFAPQPFSHRSNKVSYWFRDFVNLPTGKMSGGNLQLPVIKTNLIKQYTKQTSGCTFDLDIKIEILNASVSIGYIAVKIHGALMNALTKSQQSPTDTTIPDRLYCFANIVSIVQADKTVINGTGSTMNTFFNLSNTSSSPKLSIDNATNGQFGYHTLSLNNFNFNGVDGTSTPTGYNMSATLTTYSSGRAFSDVCSGALVRLEVD